MTEHGNTKEQHMKTYTAKQWLERVMPHGEYRRFGKFILAYPTGDHHDGIRFNINGEVDTPCFDATSAHDGDSDPISRSTAINLMVKAIEAGERSDRSNHPAKLSEAEAKAFVDQSPAPKEFWAEAGEQSAQPDPYAHLPHGGWWVDKGGDVNLWWTDGDKAAWYSCDGKFIDDSILNLSGDKLTRAQAIAIIEQHKVEAAKVENPHRSPSVNAMIELIQVLRDALGDEWDKSGVTAHAINNLITARIQEASNDTR